MAITQFWLFKVCTCLATVFSFLKRLICRSGRGRKLSGDQITLPTAVGYSSAPKQTDVEEWTSWDEDAPTSVKIEGGNGNVASQQNALEQLEPDYFKDMTPTIRKTQKIVIKKREPLNFGIPDGSTGFSSRLAATQDMPSIHQSSELGDLDPWQENTNAWDKEEDAAWQAEEVLRQQKIADREKRAAEQERKKLEKESQSLMKKEQNKIGVKLSKQILFRCHSAGRRSLSSTTHARLYGFKSIYGIQIHCLILMRSSGHSGDRDSPKVLGTLNEIQKDRKDVCNYFLQHFPDI
ncbi:receptor-binding cancer antigen expressed on SiSo cells-like [Thomomys bottae]